MAIDVNSQLRVPGAPRRPAVAPQIDFRPVVNGVDYLVSVVDHLDVGASNVTPRDIKYAVLHLQAASEILLKTRLVREHWSLAFKDPRNATRKKYEAGDFESCTTDDTIKRLRNVAGVLISEKDEKAIGDLTRDRNALQHYGLTYNAKAVEARAGRVLDFLIRFLNEQVLPFLNVNDRHDVEEGMERVRSGLIGIESFSSERMKRLRPELNGYESQTLLCSECLQVTLVVGGGAGRCRFCDQSWTAHELMALAGGQEGAPRVQDVCPQCCTETLASDVHVASHPATAVFFCFTCATSFSVLFPCDRCGRMLEPGESAGGGEPLCGTCWESEDSGTTADNFPDLFECCLCCRMFTPAESDDGAEEVCGACMQREDARLQLPT
ncbi:hypothetical protein OOK29_24005 [Streptomyces phaeochromogenes]|uniref:hypothetical protein n=1 Tax=Streptomyces phaeochromogenes TaxID=1923 RepID=UPI0022568C0C|nr:hypothetical protein [Streptomyces phaeochromogenes]MCX5601214.1 hypothetical protein [Streptomyces phaeochromogenes]